MRFGFAIDSITGQLGLIRTLRGLTPIFGRFDDGQFDELLFESRFCEEPGLALAAGSYWIRKLQARFFAGDYASALDASLRAQQLLRTSPSYFETAEYHFYSALSRRHPGIPHRRRKAATFQGSCRPPQTARSLGEACPENFENRAALVGAEIARIEGRELDAAYLYEHAIRSAHANGFVHNEALANEFAARFYAARGFDKSHTRICGTPGTAISVGEPTARYANSIDVSAAETGTARTGSDKHDRSTSRISRSRDGDQSIASHIGRDRSG